MKKILSVVGGRPNYIKISAVYEAFSIFEHVIVDTGQHYDYEMNKIFFSQLNIPDPHYFLSVGSGSHGYQVGEIVKRVEEVLVNERPDIVVVYGDTNSTLGGALASVKAGFKVAHIEAGGRVFDMSMPEEINRRIVDHISYLLFAPTPSMVRNLLDEKVPGRVFLVGDVHVYLLKKYIHIAEESSNILYELQLEHEKYILVTLHRAENVDDINKLTKILHIIKDISKYEKIVFPIHPRTMKMMNKAGLDAIISNNDNVILTQPLGYIDFIKLLNHSKLVVTDSGGVQREAYLLRKPAVVLRKSTEWIELVEAKQIMLYDIEKEIDTKKIIEWELDEYIDGLLGDEKAPERIAKIINSIHNTHSC